MGAHGYKMYYTPSQYMKMLINQGIGHLPKMSPDEARKHMRQLSEQIGTDLTDPENRQARRYNMPFYMEARGKGDIHKSNTTNTDDNTENTRRGKPRGGFSFVGYDSLLPKEEAIQEMARRIKGLQTDAFGGTLHHVKTSDPVDPNVDDVDPQRDWPEEYVAAKVNPLEQVAGYPRLSHDARLFKLLDGFKPLDIEGSYETPEERDKLYADNLARQRAFFATPEKLKIMRQMGINPGSIKRFLERAERETFWSKNEAFKRAAEILSMVLEDQNAEKLARDYYESKGSISDETEKDIVSRPTA
jgi:hypothetical protein